MFGGPLIAQPAFLVQHRVPRLPDFRLDEDRRRQRRPCLHVMWQMVAQKGAHVFTEGDIFGGEVYIHCSYRSRIVTAETPGAP